MAIESLIFGMFFFCFRELVAAGLGCRIHGTPPPPPPPPSLPPSLHEHNGLLANGNSNGTGNSNSNSNGNGNGNGNGYVNGNELHTVPVSHHWHHCPELHKAIDGVRFIADHTKREEDSTRASGFLIFHPHSLFLGNLTRIF